MSEIHDAARRIRDEKEQLREFIADLRPHTFFHRRLRSLRSRLERLQENGPLRRVFLTADPTTEECNHKALMRSIFS